MTTGAVITTHNEADTIGELVRTLRAMDVHPFVVDAGSNDGTWRKANDAGATVRVWSERLPLRDGLLQGWRLALDWDCDPIVQLDAGGSHDPADFHGLKAAMDFDDPAPWMVLGSRFLPWGDAPGEYIGNRRRAFMSRLAAVACNLKTGRRFTDWTSGYRLFRADALRLLLAHEYRSRGHAFQIEVLANAIGHGFPIAEAPITYRAGRSSFNRAAAREAFDLWRGLSCT